MSVSGLADPLVTETIRRIVSVTRFGAVALSGDGRLAVLASLPDGATQLWIGGDDKPLAPVELQLVPRSGPLAFAPGGDLLAFTTAAGPSRCGLCLYDGTPAPRVAVVLDGAIEEVHWSRDGRELLLLAVEPGGDTASPGGAVRSPHAGEGPVVRRHDSGRRRLYSVDTASGAATGVDCADTVWEASWHGGGLAAAITSTDVTESGWYRAQLATVELDSGRLSPLHASEWQLASLALSPDGARLAFVEGLSSDRGLTPGSIRVADLPSGEISTPPCTARDVTWVDWLDDGELVYAGWDGCGCAVGCCHLDGGERTLWRGPQTLGFAWRPQLALAGRRGAGVLEGHAAPPEVQELDLSPGPVQWRPRTTVNRALTLSDEPAARELSWEAADGLEIRGLLRQPAAGRARPALVVLAHGGPTVAWTHGHSPGRGLAAALVAAGFTVLLPNPRGSSGRGESFVGANIGDLGGGDFDDIVAGVRCVREQAFGGREVPAGIAGASYGGFLACWAAATGECFATAVAISVVSDWISCLYTSSTGGFIPVWFPSAGAQVDEELCRRRSPIAAVGPQSVPTLVVAGELDECTPASQGVEFYNALRLAGVESELVVYPGEGHALSRPRNQADLIGRSVEWFARHLLGFVDR